jgi:hypothetical protein
MRPSRLRLTALLALVVAACAPSGGTSPTVAAGPSGSVTQPSVIPLIVSKEQVVGPNRFLFSFLDSATNTPAATPDRTAVVAFIGPGATQPGPAVTGTFTWGIVGSKGVYIANVNFSTAGDWTALFVTQVPGKASEAIGVAFQVLEHGTTIQVGQKAPSAVTPTAADVGGDLARIATDPNPSPVFYQLSIADALSQGRPFVLVFATPALCQSKQCGPTLDVVKVIAKTAPGNVAFINVEPYKLTFTEGRLQPVLDASNQLQTVDAVNQWGLTSEPWVFTVDATGVVRGSFEGIVGTDELKAAIAVIAGT